MSSDRQQEEEKVDPVVGRVLGGEYRIDSKLGAGGMSDVYLAHQLSVDRPVVVKVMIPPSTDVERWKGRFMREARAASQIRHGGVVTIYSFGEEEEVGPFIAMEFVEGRSLRDLIVEEAPLEPYRAAELVAQGCRALHAAHSHGVVHRDLKPDNLMVEVEDGRERTRVLDFGVAKAADALVETLDGHVVGTPAYMAPEQARDQDVDGRADVYSMGIILFELLTGERPFNAPTAVAIMLKHVQEPFPIDKLDVPDDLRDVLARAVAKSPEERWGTAREFAEALEQVVQVFRTPAELGAISTDQVEQRRQTPTGAIPIPESDEFEVQPTRIGSEIAPAEPNDPNARVALLVSLGALALAVVAVGFLIVSSLDDGTETVVAEDSSGAVDEATSGAIEVLEAPLDEAERREATDRAVTRARSGVAMSARVAERASAENRAPKGPENEATPDSNHEPKVDDDGFEIDLLEGKKKGK